MNQVIQRQLCRASTGSGCDQPASLAALVREGTGLSVQGFADFIGRDRGTLQNWWKNHDPLLWLAVVGYKVVQDRGPTLAPVGGEKGRAANKGPRGAAMEANDEGK
jgi:DNA-binding transcriptional regulator YiaG